MTNEQERADFEMWCHTRSLDIGRDDKGDYISLETYLSWEAYQAGRASLQSQDRASVMGAIQRLPRYNFGYVSDEWGMGRQLGAIQKDDGRFLRVDDVMEAIDHARRIEGDL